MKIKLTFFYLLIIISVVGYGQDIKLNFRNISVKDGLKHSDVTSITQDENGMLWIGTLAGLNKYNGYDLKGYSNKNYLLESVYKNRINKLISNTDFIWLATEGGLDCFNIINEDYVKLNWNLLDDSFITKSEVLSIFISSFNKLFVLTNTELKAFEIQKNSMSSITLQEVRINNMSFDVSFFDMKVDENGINWLISEKNLYYLKETDNEISLQKIEVTNGKKNFSGFFGLFAKEKNYLLIGVENGFLKANTSVLDMDEELVLSTTYYGINNPLINVQNPYNTRFTINTFEQGLNNSIWLGSSYGLIEASLKGNTYEYTFYNNGSQDLTSSGIVSLFKDKSGCLWVSNYEGGVNCADLFQKNFYSLVHQSGFSNSLSENYVRAITEDHKGNIWIGTEISGLNYYDFKTKEIRQIKHIETNPNSLLSNGIRALLIDDEKRLWVGTMDGISVYDVKTNNFHNITSKGSIGKSITNNVVFSMDKDKFGNIWAGSWHNGLNRIRYNDKSNFEVEKIYKKQGDNYGLSSNVVTFIYADKYFPEVFVGTDKGLNHVFLNEDGSIKDIKSYVGNSNIENSLSSNFIWPTVRENDSILWVGTLGGGLNELVLNQKLKLGYKATSFSTHEGAPSADIESIIYDKENQDLWLGGAGLSRFNTKTKRFNNFDEEDGLVGNSFKVGAAHKGESGRFYFGSTAGLTYFYPSKIVNNNYVPNIILTDLIINNKPVKIGEASSNKVILKSGINYQNEFTFSHTENNFQILFSTDHYANPNKVKFKYKLLGYDKDWVFVSAKDRKASFTNLPYGSYVFQVTGTNADGMWSNEIKSIKLDVLAPWWYTNWAKTGYFVLFISFLVIGFFAIVRWFKLKKAYEISILEEQQKEQLYQLRAEFFTNVSHEFKTPLSLIFNPLEKLIGKKDVSETQRNKYYHLMYKNAKRLIKLVNELIDYRKVNTNTYKLDIETNDLMSFISETEDFFRVSMKKKAIKIQMKNDLKNGKFQFDIAVLEKIIFNIWGNAIKFSPENSQISIKLSEDPIAYNELYKNSIVVDSDYMASNYVYIAIEDEGVGIDSGNIHHIFDRFFQGGDSSNSLGGSGIGLTLVKSLVQLHKARLQVFSEPNVGTQFILQIPIIDYFKVFPDLIKPSSVRLSSKVLDIIKDAENKIKIKNIELYETFTKPTILLVEDNEELRSFIKDDFQEEYHILEASHGIEALEVIKNNIVQLIISDIMMPEMDGIEFCKIIKSSPHYKNIPLIMLTAKFQVENQIEGMQSGADIYMPKPFSLDVLKLNISNILKTRKELKEKIIENSFEEARKATTNKSDDKFLKKLVDIIDENIADVTFDVEKLSRILGVSKSTLYNSVKLITSESIGGLIRNIRLKKAAQILSSSDLNIIQVMEMVGIQSQSHFTKSFKKEFGVTPSEFKAKLK